MTEQVFLDTDILIDFSQDQSEAVETITQLPKHRDSGVMSLHAQAGFGVQAVRYLS